MKKLRRLALLLVSILCLSLMSGCMRYSTTIDVKKNGTADLTMVVAVYDTSNLDDSSDSSDIADEDSEDMKKLEDQGWDVELYQKDGYIGYTCSKKGIKLQDIAKEMQQSESDDADINVENFKVKKNGSTYTVDWQIYDEENTDEMAEYKDSLSSYGGYINVVVSLPYKPKNHNATSVSEDGKTLTWNLLEMDRTEPIHVEFSLFNWGLIIGIIVAVLVVAIAVIVFFILRGKMGNRPPKPVPPQPGFGGQPPFDPNQQFGGQPQQPFGMPQQQYGMPNQQFGSQPQQQYGMPNQQFGGQPQQQYGQPQQPFGMPNQQFGGQPQQQYGQPQMDPNQQFGGPNNQQ